MDWAILASRIIKAILAAETIWPIGNGTLKKQTVMDVAKNAVNTGIEVSTGGQKETWQEAEPLVDDFVEASVKIMNRIKPGTVDIGSENTSISAG